MLLPEGAAPAAFDFESPPSSALQPLEDPEAALEVDRLAHSSAQLLCSAEPSQAALFLADWWCHRLSVHV